MSHLPEDLQHHPYPSAIFHAHYWLLGTILTLEAARKAAGLTIDELAHRLHTTPAWIRQTERDDTGALFIRDYIAWMVACGRLPDPIIVHSLPESSPDSLIPTDP